MNFAYCSVKGMFWFTVFVGFHIGKYGTLTHVYHCDVIQRCQSCRKKTDKDPHA